MSEKSRCNVYTVAIKVALLFAQFFRFNPDLDPIRIKVLILGHFVEYWFRLPDIGEKRAGSNLGQGQPGPP